MTISIVQSGDSIGLTSSNTIALTLTGVTAGSALVARIDWYSGAITISSVTCTAESNLTVHGAKLTVNSEDMQFASLGNVTTGGSKTITVTLSSAALYRSLVVFEVAGGHPSNFFDVESDTTGTSTDPTGSITTTQPSCAVFAVTSSASGVVTTAGAGFTLQTVVSGNINASDGTEYDLDVGAAGVKSVPFVNSSSSAWAVKSAAFNVDTTGHAIFNLPALTFNGVGGFLGFFKDLPMLTLAAGNPRAIFDLPMLTLSSAGAMEPTGTAEFSLPMLTAVMAGGAPSQAAFNLPVLTLVGVGSAGGVGISEFFLPIATLTGAGLTGDVGAAEFDLPSLLVAVEASQAGLGDAAFNLPFPTLSAIGFTGGTDSAVFNLPVITLSVAAHQSITGEAAFDLPLFYLEAQGAATLAAAYRTWVLNVRKGALTEYNNFSFNSFARFNGVTLACGPSGVFVLGTQDTDAGTAITGKYRTGLYGNDSAWASRVPRAYLDGSQAGDLRFRVITTEGGTREYNVQWNKITGHTQRRVPIGKGIKSRWFQYEVENVGGANFSTKSLMTYPTKLRRRIAG